MAIAARGGGHAALAMCWGQERAGVLAASTSGRRAQGTQHSYEPVFNVLTIEDGREVKLAASPFVIGVSATATRYIPDALTTLSLSVKPGNRVCEILNIGDRPVYVGRKLIQPLEMVQLPAGVRAQCRMTNELTVAIFSMIDGKD